MSGAREVLENNSSSERAKALRALKKVKEFEKRTKDDFHWVKIFKGVKRVMKSIQ
jgi:hypothetical protein